MSGQRAAPTAPPGTWRIEVDGGGSFAMAAAEDRLLRGALRAGMAWPYECSVGGCGSCRFELLEGEVEDTWPQAPGLSARERQRGKRLACQTRVLSDLRVRVRLPPVQHPGPAARRFTAKLLARRDLTGDMAEFTFAAQGGAHFLPGQYALFYLPGVTGARAYSMSNLPNGDGLNSAGLWQFIVKRVPQGQAGDALFERLAPADAIEIDAPYGQAFLRPPAGRDLVCIAGGSGLGPMLAIVRGVLAEPGARRVHLFVGLRSQADLGALAVVQGLANDRLGVTTVLSAPGAEPPWHGPTGLVHEAVERLAPAALCDLDFYLAGPVPMVDAVQTMLLVRHRIHPDRVRFDRFA